MNGFLKNYLNKISILELPFVGIDISDRCIRYFELENTSNKYNIKKCGEIGFPEGSFKSGDFLNKSEVISALKLLKKDLRLNMVKVSIPEEKTYLYNTVVPDLSSKEVKQMVEFSLPENVPLEVGELLFEYTPVRKFSDGRIEVSVTVVPKKTVEDYIDVFKQSGINIISFCTEMREISRAVTSKENLSYLLVYMKEKSTVISVVEDGNIKTSATVSIGSDNLADKVSVKNISTSQCFKIPEETFFKNISDSSDFIYEIANVVSVLRDEIIKFRDFWKKKNFNNNEVKKVILCGRATAIPGLIQYLSNSTKMSFEIANVWSNVIPMESQVPPIKFIDSLDFGSVIGLCLKD